MTPTLNCPECQAVVQDYEAFCQSCGARLSPTAAPPTQAAASADPPSSQTRRLVERASQATLCLRCGGRVDADGYCGQCGAKAPSERDHFEAAPADWVAGVCDRGQAHAVNEDAMALWADADRAVLVVCDGVSSSSDSARAALAAAEAALGTLGNAVSTPESDLDAAFAAAASHANLAVLEASGSQPDNPPASTIAIATVTADGVRFGGVGDSRVYWLGPQPRCLTADDSVAAELIGQGVPREVAEESPQAHAITRWLGQGTPGADPRVGRFQPDGPGWLLVCSDGLWNYASSAEELAELVASLGGDDPAALARQLVKWANQRGGHDNITAALARVRP
ncbi:MAG: protein phosphatase 2C domain-containing protein [Propionibacteriaceae bacterium]|jgi:serine/threonine protein phosphatase PrpC|nr:protein phosphatase 2C domain-containing protein [Propionibacteriaceae bacterium]